MVAVLQMPFCLSMEINFKEPDEEGVVTPKESGIRYSTYLGGSERDEAYGFAFDNDLNMYVAGLTHSSSFPITPNSFQANFKVKRMLLLRNSIRSQTHRVPICA